jgi:phosphonate transport system substrate-binding protein
MDKDSVPGTETQNQPAIQSPSPPTENQTLAQPTAPEPKPAMKGMLVIVIVAVLVLAAAVTGGIYLWHHFSSRKVTPPAVATIPDKEVIKVGTIIDENGLAADQQEFAPFISYLAAQLHSQGIVQGRFVPETSVATMAELLRQNKVDLYIDSLFPVFVADQLSGSRLIMDRWKGLAQFYHTGIFVKTDSPIKTLADLKGHVLAFDSSTSTVAYFLPKSLLLQMGYKVIQVQKPTDTVPPDTIGYAFVGANVYDDVQNGITAAGAESELEIRDHFGPTFDQNYRIIWKSQDILRFAVAIRGNIDPSLSTAINTILTNMDQTAAGRKVLDEYAQTAKFTDVSATDFGQLENLTSYVQNEIVTGGVGATSTSQ